MISLDISPLCGDNSSLDEREKIALYAICARRLGVVESVAGSSYFINFIDENNALLLDCGDRRLLNADTFVQRFLEDLHELAPRTLHIHPLRVILRVNALFELTEICEKFLDGDEAAFLVASFPEVRRELHSHYTFIEDLILHVEELLCSHCFLGEVRTYQRIDDEGVYDLLESRLCCIDLLFQ